MDPAGQPKSRFRSLFFPYTSPFAQEATSKHFLSSTNDIAGPTFFPSSSSYFSYKRIAAKDKNNTWLELSGLFSTPRYSPTFVTRLIATFLMNSPRMMSLLSFNETGLESKAIAQLMGFLKLLEINNSLRSKKDFSRRVETSFPLIIINQNLFICRWENSV